MLDAKTAVVPDNAGHAYDNSQYARFDLGEVVTITDEFTGKPMVFCIGDLIEYNGERGWISNLKESGGNLLCFTQLNPWLAPEGYFSHGRFITEPENVVVLDSPRFNVTDEEVQEAIASIATVQTER